MTSEHFEIGEVAIYVRPGSPYYGREVEVLSGLHIAGAGLDHMGGSHDGGDPVYTISRLSARPGVPQLAKPEWLRKKKPPRREIDQVVSWSDCLWRPSRITA